MINQIKKDKRNCSYEMILKQKLERVSEDLSTGSFGAWVNILLFTHPAFQTENSTYSQS